MLFLEIFRIT